MEIFIHNTFHLVYLLLNFLMIYWLRLTGIGVVAIDGLSYYDVIYLRNMLEPFILKFRCSSGHHSI